MSMENFLKEARSVLDEFGEKNSKINSLIEENNKLKNEILENKAIIHKFIKRLKELNFDKSQFDSLRNENTLLKNKFNEKLAQTEGLSAKIDNLTRVLVKGDEFIHDLKASYDEKQKEVEFLTKKLRFLTADQKARLTDLRENLKTDAKMISILRARVGELEAVEKMKEEANASLRFKDDEIGRLSKVINQFKSRAESLEEINKKLMKENQELGYKIKGFEDRNKKIRVFEKKKEESFRKGIEEEIEKRMSNSVVPVAGKVSGFSVNDLETNEIKAMIKTAAAHGDSLEKIKNSLLSSGYKEEKIEKALSFYNNSF